jgi:hypothetical protein
MVPEEIAHTIKRRRFFGYHEPKLLPEAVVK